MASQNSRIRILKQLAAAFVKDASATYPSKAATFERDLERIVSLVQTRGESVFTIDFPRIDKALTRALADGSLHCGGLPYSRPTRNAKVPRLFQGLWLELFANDGTLLGECDPNAILLLRQILCLGKKIVQKCPSPYIRKATNEYKAIDGSLRPPTLQWGTDNLFCGGSSHDVHFHDYYDLDCLPGIFDLNDLREPRGNGYLLLENLQRTCDRFVESAPSFSLSSAIAGLSRRERGRGFRNGPGAVAHGPAIVDKSFFECWSTKLESAFPTADCLGDVVTNLHRDRELPSRLVAVPKDATKPRLIAAEPAENQYCQQFLLAFLADEWLSLTHGAIKLHDQGASKDAARQASLSGDMATVDLSSASDRLSCFAVERAFRLDKSFLKALNACRTSYASNSIEGTDHWTIKLNKFATQGSATTFPVQSLFFWLCAISIGHFRKEKERIKECRVFGDDIIIPNTWYDDFVLLLTTLELKVNDDKSFSSGLFRESCGGDYWSGFDVTPVKPQTLSVASPSAIMSAIDTSNNFYVKGLWHMADATMRMIPKRVKASVPILGSQKGGVGFLSFSNPVRVPKFRFRWNSDLCRMEMKVWTSVVKRKPIANDQLGALSLYTKYRPSPSDEASFIARHQVIGSREGLRWEVSPYHTVKAR